MTKARLEKLKLTLSSLQLLLLMNQTNTPQVQYSNSDPSCLRTAESGIVPPGMLTPAIQQPEWRQQNPVYRSPLPISRDFSSDREPQSHTVTEPSVDAAKTSPGLQEILEGTQNIVYEAREEIPGVWYTGNRLTSCSYVALGRRCCYSGYALVATSRPCAT